MIIIIISFTRNGKARLEVHCTYKNILPISEKLSFALLLFFPSLFEQWTVTGNKLHVYGIKLIHVQT